MCSSSTVSASPFEATFKVAGRSLRFDDPTFSLMLRLQVTMGPHGFTITRTALLATLLFSLMYLGQSLEPVGESAKSPDTL